MPTQADILAVLRSLVAFPTVSSDSNLALIEWVEAYLDSYGIPHWRINESVNKSSLLARIGPDTPGGIVLSGHTDVVPVKGQPWVTDPFTLIEKDTLVHGRGTCDMKSFLALALAHVPLFKESCLTRCVWFAFSHDEEIGCLGAAPMAQALIDRNAAPSLVVIGEPTDMKLIGAHKGILSFETIITGREAHSSMPEQGVNAVMLMGELIGTLNNIAADARLVKDEDFSAVTPYASVHVGVVEGGTARNIVPRYCRIAWEVRPLPATDMEALLAPFQTHVAQLEAEMKKIDVTCSIVTNQLTNVRGLQKVPDDAPHLALAHRLANANAADAVAFGTEGGIFQGHGLNVIVCGPGSIDQAHQPNEFVSLEQLELGAEFMLRVAEACK
ncbi:MAG: acetylornithine deacetylase [Rickettsiales bacterium]